MTTYSRHFAYHRFLHALDLDELPSLHGRLRLFTDTRLAVHCLA